MKQPEPWEIAKEFAKQISTVLTSDELAEVNSLNASDGNKSICHSHDFCDANQVMLNAMETLDIDSLAVDAAWDIAKAAGFNPDHVRMEMDGLKRYESIIMDKNGHKWRDPYSYVDWFPDDASAMVDIKNIMQTMGYEVADIKIGFPCVVTLK